MKVVILAGGRGTRISEESYMRPKPMIEIGDAPILWHIMKIYSHYGYNDFVICLGYKGYLIKEYFYNYYLHSSEAVTFDFTLDNSESPLINRGTMDPWKVTLVETGLNTLTGSRVKRIQPYIGDEPFMLTYGDGVSNVNIKKLVEFHKASGNIGTITAVQPEGRFGRLELQQDQIQGFAEKVKGDGGWINGGFMVFQPEVFEYIDNLDNTILEQEPLNKLAEDGQLSAYKHNGFWQPMDTLREKINLETMWEADQAPWKIWTS